MDRVRSELRRIARQERHHRLTPTERPLSPGDQVAVGEAADVVRAAVRLLPDGQRRVVELAYFQGLSYREVALARRAADRTLELVQTAADPRAEMAVHGIRLPLGALLIARAFELWTHENDIRRAVGMPASVPDASTLRLMTELAAGLLPYAAARTGVPGPLTVRLVLTGPGGGTWVSFQG